MSLSAGVGMIFPASVWSADEPEVGFLARGPGQCRSPYLCTEIAVSGGYCMACTARFRAK